MKRIFLIFFGFAFLFSPMTIIQAQNNSPAEIENILVLYDQLAVGTEYSNNLNALETVLSAMSQTMEIMPMADYDQGRLFNYSKVIFLKNTEHPIASEILKNDINRYTGEMIYLGFLTPGLISKLDGLDINRQLGRGVSLNFNQITTDSVWINELRVINRRPVVGESTLAVNGEAYPFSTRVDNIIYVPTFIGNEGFQLCLGGLLKTWINPNESTSMVLLIPEIYPFSDLNMVVEMSDRFYENGIPFTLGVVPMDENLDYPAMVRFYEVLRYAQSRNGSILIHRPNPETVSNSDTILSEKMTAVVDAMVAQGVFPLGIVVTEELFFKDIGSVGPLNSFSSGSIIQNQRVTETGVKKAWTFEQSGLGIAFETIKSTRSQDRNFGELPINTTIILPLPVDETALTTDVDDINNKWLSLTDYKSLYNQWVIGQNTLESGPKGILINGTPVSLAFMEGTIDKDYVYKKPPDYSLEKVFNAGNTLLLVVVGIIIIIFVSIVGFSRSVYLNKFRKINKPDEKKDPGNIETDKEDQTL
ncbi:hypothetical protein [Acetobacterium bakii]|uniref:DUF2334 domain-containing protein n=1 Tax=Acetobacterium bakii TaxID=52689 RepID=A0A0L6U365_9FIRM|nr:hypothetical protein [Acetobacterium bakii]KNZ42946.1 hypothetical protein AKG39_04295 [Acetobacterium bakii]